MNLKQFTPAMANMLKKPLSDCIIYIKRISCKKEFILSLDDDTQNETMALMKRV